MRLFHQLIRRLFITNAGPDLPSSSELTNPSSSGRDPQLMSGQAFAVAAGLVGAIGAYTYMTQSESSLQAQGPKLKKTISEHAVAGAEKLT